ncbi:MAG: glucose 1-dehydrogenase [Gorillibacterium sp.]|nr:glucose 1-dehydrogenase [Gorillibacterium sp.]
MYADLVGKVAIVTGAAKGIGCEIASRYASEQMKVVINFRNEERLAYQVVAKIKESGAEAIAIQADVSKEKDCIRLLQETLSAYGKMDVMVNNAGIQTTAPSHELSLEAWNNVIAVNLTGAFLCCREAISYMLAHNQNGSIINISRVHQKIPKPSHVHYASSKGGLKAMTETLALEYAPFGIRINSIAPGAIITSMNEQIFTDPIQKADVLALIPMNKIGNPEHVASAAAWLASTEACYITGTTLFVDGGMALYPSYHGR